MIALMKNGTLWLEHGSGIIHNLLCLLTREYAKFLYLITSIQSHVIVNHNLLLAYVRISAYVIFDKIEQDICIK